MQSKYQQFHRHQRPHLPRVFHYSNMNVIMFLTATFQDSFHQTVQSAYYHTCSHRTENSFVLINCRSFLDG
ncbi:unnamed protein product [Brugia timori]|uniref:Ovule protein n=1 Tax=Brugia timori TaxID=42155 RepID=A0A0R3RCF5_9BILA|nr:unnamed protein product [Brugia timori]